MISTPLGFFLDGRDDTQDETSESGYTPPFRTYIRLEDSLVRLRSDRDIMQNMTQPQSPSAI
jgi:hypothetical protein